MEILGGGVSGGGRMITRERCGLGGCGGNRCFNKYLILWHAQI